MQDFLIHKGMDVKIMSIDDFNPGELSNSDFLLLGCWTSGLMICLQHPEKKWVRFAEGLSDLTGKKIGLFTTYKLATGTMFKKMKVHIPGKQAEAWLELKSRNGHLSEMIKSELTHFIETL